MTTLAADDVYRAHLWRIQGIVARWQAGELELDEKRREIAAANRDYYGGDYRSPILRTYITSATKQGGRNGRRGH